MAFLAVLLWISMVFSVMAQSEKTYIVTVAGGLTSSSQSQSVETQIEETLRVPIQKTISIGKLQFLVLQTTPEVSEKIRLMAGVKNVQENMAFRINPLEAATTNTAEEEIELELQKTTEKITELYKQNRFEGKEKMMSDLMRMKVAKENKISYDHRAEEGQTEDQNTVLSITAESDKTYIVTVAGGLTSSSQSQSVKSQIQETLRVPIQKTISIGKLQFLVLQTTPEVSEKIRLMAGVKNVQENMAFRINPLEAATTNTSEEETDLKRKNITEKTTGIKKQIRFYRKEKRSDISRMKVASNKAMCREQPSGESLWGLTRIVRRGDNRSPDDPASDVYTYSDSDDGKGVDIFIVDTGIFTDHEDFNGRAVLDFTASEIRKYDGDGDKNGHGTHVAGTAGGRGYGVAKGVMLRSVKVLDWNGDDGTTITLLEGLDYIEKHFLAEKRSTGKRPKYIVNMSLGWGEKVEAIDRAMKRMARMGVLFVVAAGNEKEDACNGTPAHLAEVITVGATNRSDYLWSHSNHGRCVDILAPGSDILSASFSDNSAGLELSGTSMAAPHVAGVIARYIQHMDEPPMPAEIKAWLKDTATKGVVKVPSSTTDALLYKQCDPNPKDGGDDEEDETGEGSTLAGLQGGWVRNLMVIIIITGVVILIPLYMYRYRYMRTLIVIPTVMVILLCLYLINISDGEL